MATKISVIIPCYNQACFLNEAVASVKAQTFSDWECIIVNDGSTDETEDVALQLCASDSRVKYVCKENGGLSSARNLGLDQAKGEYIQFLDADDRLDPDKFRASLSFDGEAELMICNFYFFGGGEEERMPPFKLDQDCFNFSAVLMDWDEKFVIPIHCGLLKASLFTNCRFSEELKAREDWVMWLRLFQEYSVRAVFIDQPLAFYRLSATSMSQDKSLMHQSLVSAYRIVYHMVPEEYKERFFNLVLRRLGSLLAETERQLQKTKQSKSYRLGNFFISRLNRLNV